MSFGGSKSVDPKTQPYIGGPLEGGSGRDYLAGGHSDVVSEGRRTKEEARRADMDKDERNKLGPLAPITKGESIVRNSRLRREAFSASKSLGVS